MRVRPNRRLLALMTVLLLLTGLLGPLPARANSGPEVPLILIHGLLGSPTTTWASATVYFQSRGYVEGRTLFRLNLQSTGGEGVEMGVLSDTTFAANEIRRIMRETGAKQVDLLGNSRGGLVVRLLTSGDLAPAIRRAATINTPHAGVLGEVEFDAMLEYARINASQRAMLAMPPDLVAGKTVIATMQAREARFSDQRVPALAIASIFIDGHAAVLHGHDGFISQTSQLAWPGARTRVNKIGPTPQQLNNSISLGLGIVEIVSNIPHVVSTESQANLQAAYEFFADATITRPARACEPGCQDFALLAGHWSDATVRPMLPHLLPYTVDARQQRVFEPNRQITRAEFVYGLARFLGMNEKLEPTAFVDTRGHWSLGYVQAAVEAKLVTGITADSFGPDQPLTRAQAATLIVRQKQLPLATAPSRFADARGHWAEANIEAAATAGIIIGDERGFRPNDPLTMAEAAVILGRSFPR